MKEIILEENQFTAYNNGLAVGFLKFRMDGNKIDIYTVFVNEDQRQFKFGPMLLQASIDYVKENGFEVIPTCPYIEKNLEKYK